MNPAHKKATACLLISCNVSHRGALTEDVLMDVIHEKTVPDKWLGHIDCFFNEVPQKIFMGFLKENDLSPQDLEPLYHALPSILQGKNFQRVKDAG